MPDPNAKTRAAARFVEMMTPAAALGVKCRECGAEVGPCLGPVDPYDLGNKAVMPKPKVHDVRLEHARAELHALALTLFDVG